MTALVLRDVLGWKVATAGFEDEIPRVLDIDLAEHLGYPRPRKIRDLIKRLVSEGKLNDSELRTTVGQSMGRPASEIWLTRKQALKVISKSETALADSIMDEVLCVFEVVLDGGKPLAAPALDEERVMERVERIVAPILEALAAVTKLVSDASGCRISAADASSLKRQVQLIAKMRSQGNSSSKGENSERRIIYNRLGAAVAWTGSGRRWDGLPASKVADVMALLQEMRADALRALPSVDDLQLKLSYQVTK